MSSTTYNLITKQLENLPEEMQKKVLKYVKNLQKDILKGVSGNQLIKFAGCISNDEYHLLNHKILTKKSDRRLKK